MVNENQTMDFTPAPELRIADLDTLRVLADPQRFRLVEAMATRPREAWTVKQLARTVGAAPTKLYYHMNLLEEHGLIVVTGSRLVSGILEKRYQVAADQLSVDRALFETGDPATNETLHTVLSTILDTTQADIRAAVKAGIASLHHEEGDPEREPIFLSKGYARLSRARAVEFRARLKELYAEFEEIPKAGARGADVHGTEEADARTTDARGTDAERTDVESTDAGRTDAEGTDAQGTDAQGTDAQGTDAGRTEAERTDAERTDAEGTHRAEPAGEAADRHPYSLVVAFYPVVEERTRRRRAARPETRAPR